ncbi:TolC family protein [Ferrimonas aestuarii]|uniref:TolC family protein n=1 Tax=Ferrimonas aestuarii TaxID=2569539 RepID=A0A4U1BK85_9GAMM|nr:TolC family protein [Ferrimonas aestuarii]TKB52026.1 TolC family protein [Ferrimonas aestuarii]
MSTLCLRTALLAVSVSAAMSVSAHQAAGVTQTQLSEFAASALAQLDALPEIQAQKAQLAAAELATHTAEQPLYNPELSFDVESIGHDTDPEDYTLSVSQAIDWADKRGYRSRSAQLLALSAQTEYQLARNQALATLLTAWVNLRQAGELDGYAQLQFERTEAMLALAKQMANAGELAPLDSQLLQLELARISANRSDAKVALAQAQRGLKLAGGDTALAMPAITQGATLPSTEVTPQLAPMKTQYQQVLAARAQFELSKVEAKADPSVSLGAKANKDDTSFQLGVSMPLNVRNQYQGEIAEANQQIVVAEKQYLASQRNLKINLDALKTQYLAVASSLRQWQQLTQDSLGDSQGLLERLWRAGELPTSQYLQSQQQLTDTYAAGSELSAEKASLWIEMMAERGELESWLQAHASQSGI